MKNIASYIAAALFVAWVVALSVMVGAAFEACATTVNAEKTVDLDIWQGPPCKIVVKADGKIVHTTNGKTVKCGVVVEP